jgi:hypothetical protein
MKTYKIETVMNKINRGDWEAMNDVRIGGYVEIRNTTSNKRFTILVK